MVAESEIEMLLGWRRRRCFFCRKGGREHSSRGLITHPFLPSSSFFSKKAVSVERLAGVSGLQGFVVRTVEE